MSMSDMRVTIRLVKEAYDSVRFLLFGYGRTYVRTENLPILQDFVPYRGRCPKSSQQHKINAYEIDRKIDFFSHLGLNYLVMVETKHSFEIESAIEICHSANMHFNQSLRTN